MAHYYYITTALPPLDIGVKPEISFKELKDIVAANATKSDLEKVGYLLQLIDLSNIRSLWMGMPLDERGVYTPKELEEELLVRENLPEFLDNFLDLYDSPADRLRNFPSLYASFYRDMEQKMKSGFLRQYFIMEREIRLVLSALRAKRFGRDIVRELQFEDSSEPLVMDILAQKDAAEYTPPKEYEDLKALFLNYVADPKQLYRALLEYRFKKIVEMEEGDYFSIDSILGYMARLLLVESWQGLKHEEGTALIDDMSKH